MCFSKDAIVDVKFRNGLKVNFTIRPIVGIIVSLNTISDIWLYYDRLKYISRFSEIENGVSSAESFANTLINIANAQATPDNAYNVIFPMDKDVLEELDRGIFHIL